MTTFLRLTTTILSVPFVRVIQKQRNADEPPKNNSSRQVRKKESRAQNTDRSHTQRTRPRRKAVRQLEAPQLHQDYILKFTGLVQNGRDAVPLLSGTGGDPGLFSEPFFLLILRMSEVAAGGTWFREHHGRGRGRKGPTSYTRTQVYTRTHTHAR